MVGVIGALLAITLPMLGNGRDQAKWMGVLAHQRSVGGVLLQYTSDHDDLVPYWGTPGELEIVAQLRPDAAVTLPWEFQGIYWSSWIHERGYSDAIAAATVPLPGLDTPPDRLPPERWYSAIHMISPTFYAAPRLFAASQPGSTNDRNIGQRVAQVSYPSQKGMLMLIWEAPDVPSFPPYDPSKHLVTTFADGHAERRQWRKFLAGTTFIDWVDSEPVPVMCTIDGIHGRDIR